MLTRKQANDIVSEFQGVVIDMNGPNFLVHMGAETLMVVSPDGAIHPYSSNPTAFSAASKIKDAIRHGP